MCLHSKFRGAHPKCNRGRGGWPKFGSHGTEAEGCTKIQTRDQQKMCVLGSRAVRHLRASSPAIAASRTAPSPIAPRDRPLSTSAPREAEGGGWSKNRLILRTNRTEIAGSRTKGGGSPISKILRTYLLDGPSQNKEGSAGRKGGGDSEE